MFRFFKRIKKDKIKDKIYIYLDKEKNVIDFLIYKPEVIFDNYVKKENTFKIIEFCFVLDYFLNRKQVVENKEEYEKRIEDLQEQKNENNIEEIDFTNFPYYSKNITQDIKKTIFVDLENVLENKIYSFNSLFELMQSVSKKDYQEIFEIYNQLKDKDREFIFNNYYLEN